MIDTSKLAKLCGMFSSNHMGERANAAAMADKIVRSAGLTWDQLFSKPPQAAKPSSLEEVFEFIHDRKHQLSEWEYSFVGSVFGQFQLKGTLSEKQWAKLFEIQERLCF